jgi:hypothetical protein
MNIKVMQIEVELIPPNLADFGLKQATMPGIADLITIWRTPYPVLTRYEIFCEKLGIEPFAGGTYQLQGHPNKVGYITSGYRDDIIEGRNNSPHRFALAIDVIIGGIEQQVQAAFVASQLFPRIGLYPHNGFLHLDLANSAWMKKYGGRRYWVRDKLGHYFSFDDLQNAIECAQTDI